MDEVIKNICNALKVQALALSRLDEVEHIQNLTIELTKMMSTGALSASSMGEGEGEENEQ